MKIALAFSDIPVPVAADPSPARPQLHYMVERYKKCPQLIGDEMLVFAKLRNAAMRVQCKLLDDVLCVIKECCQSLNLDDDLSLHGLAVCIDNANSMYHTIRSLEDSCFNICEALGKPRVKIVDRNPFTLSLHASDRQVITAAKAEDFIDEIGVALRAKNVPSGPMNRILLLCKKVMRMYARSTLFGPNDWPFFVEVVLDYLDSKGHARVIKFLEDHIEEHMVESPKV